MRGLFLWRSGAPLTEPFAAGWDEGDCGGGLRGGASGSSTLICRGWETLLRTVAEGERGLGDTNGILVEEWRAMRAWSCGKPSVKESLAGRVIVLWRGRCGA